MPKDSNGKSMSVLRGAAWALGILIAFMLTLLSSNMVKVGDIPAVIAQQEKEIMVLVKVEDDKAVAEIKRVENESAKKEDIDRISDSIESLRISQADGIENLRVAQTTLTDAVNVAIRLSTVNSAEITANEKALDRFILTNNQRLGTLERSIDEVEAKIQ